MTKSKQEIYNNRPTSPHITIYRKQISSVLSILHRLTGIALFAGLSMIVWWFIILAFNKFNIEYLLSIEPNLIKLPIMAISFAWFYHLCNGIRHLIWDSGYCFTIKAINVTGWLVIACSFAMSLALWLAIW